MTRIMLIKCDKPAFDLDGVTDIGTCAASERFDEGVCEQDARARGWTTDPDRCPWHGARKPAPFRARKTRPRRG